MNWESDWRDPDDSLRWPRGRTFDPGPGNVIPTGRFNTKAPQPPPVRPLDTDLAALRRRLTVFTEEVRKLRRLLAASPRDQAAIDRVGRDARLARTLLIGSFERMRDRVRSGFYLRNGSTKRTMAKVTCELRPMGHLHCDPRDPNLQRPEWMTDEEVRRRYCELIFHLRQSRGELAQTPCSAL